MTSSFRIVFITQDDPFYVRCFFSEFFRIYPDLGEIQAVVIQSPFGKKSTWGLAKQMYNFYGPVVGAAVLLYLRLQVGSQTQYWPLILGTFLAVLLFFFPGGIMGFLQSQLVRIRGAR